MTASNAAAWPQSHNKYEAGRDVCVTKESLRLSPLRDSVSKGKLGCTHGRALEGLHLERNVPRPGTAAQESIRTVDQNPNKDNFIFTILKFNLHKENSRVCP